MTHNKAEESKLNRENLTNLGSDIKIFKSDIADKIDSIEHKQIKQLDGIKIVLDKGTAPGNKNNINLIEKAFSDNPLEVEKAKNIFIKPTKRELKIAINEVKKKENFGKFAIQSINIDSILESKLKANDQIKNHIIIKDKFDEFNLEGWKNNKILTIKEKMKLNIQKKSKNLMDKIKTKLSNKHLIEFKYHNTNLV